MAQTLTRAATSIIMRHLTISSLLPKRLLSTTSITHTPCILSPLFSCRSITPLSHAVRSLPLAPTCFISIRCYVNRSGNSRYPPFNSNYPPFNSIYNDRFSTESLHFPGRDYEHWLICMEKPGGEGATKQEIIDCYIKTLAKVVGSEEEAKKKIYKVSSDGKSSPGFGCELDWETALKLEELPGVLCILPDCYVGPEYKDYGGEFFVNGEIVQRSPDRQRRAEVSTPKKDPGNMI